MTFYEADIDVWNKNGDRTEEEWARRRRLIQDDIEDAERRELPVRIAVRWGGPLSLAFSTAAITMWWTAGWVPRTPPESGLRAASSSQLLIAAVVVVAAIACAAAFAWAVQQMLKVKQDSRWYERRLRDHDAAYVARDMARPTPEPSAAATETTEHSEPPTNTGSPTGRWTR